MHPMIFPLSRMATEPNGSVVPTTTPVLGESCDIFSASDKRDREIGPRAAACFTVQLAFLGLCHLFLPLELVKVVRFACAMTPRIGTTIANGVL